MGEYITESGMKFGPFPPEALIRIESIPQYRKIQQGMHISEFIYYDKEKQRLISLEEKTTAPNPNSNAVDNPKEHFQKYIRDIREKFENSLDLYLNLALKRIYRQALHELIIINSKSYLFWLLKTMREHG